MLTDREKKALARYQKQLNYPKWKFVLIYGVLSWGILTAILYSVAMLLLKQVSFNRLISQQLWINLATFMIAGILFGFLVRKMLPRYIQRLKDKENTVGAD